MSRMRLLLWTGLLGCLVLLSSRPGLAEEQSGTYAGRDAAWWIEQFADAESGPAVFVALKKIGRPALEPLGQALLSPSRPVRNGAAQALNMFKEDLSSVLPVVVTCLDTQDIAFLRLLLGVLQHAGADATPYVATIAPLTASSTEDVAQRAIAILGSIGPAARQEVPRLLEQARTGNPSLRYSLVSACVAMAPDDPSIASVLAELWPKSNEREQVKLLALVGRLQPTLSGVPDLVVLASGSASASVRGTAAGLLGEMALESESYMAALVRMLGDPDLDVRQRAAWALSKLGTRAAPALTALEKVLDDPDPTAHVAAIRALIAVGPDAAQALSRVLGALDTVPPSRDLEGAVLAFLSLTPDMTVDALRSERAQARTLAMRSIVAWPAERWLGVQPEVLDIVLAELLTRQEVQHSETRIVEVWGQLATRSARAQEALLALRAAQAPQLRSLAARTLGAVPEFEDLLLELLGSPDPLESEFAQAGLELALGMHRSGDLRKKLFSLTVSESEELARRAQQLLVRFLGYLEPGTIDPRQAEVLAARAAKMLGDPQAQSVALTCLGALGAFALPHVEDIAPLLGLTAGRSNGMQAAWTLSNLARHAGEDGGRPAALLVEAATGSDPLAAACAANGLTSLRAHQELVVELLPQLILHERRDVAHPALSAAQSLGPRGAALTSVLVAASADGGRELGLRSMALGALAAAAPQSEVSVRAHLAALADPVFDQAPHAVTGGLRAGGETTIRLAAEALADSRAEVQVILLQVLEAFGLAASSVRDRVRPLTQSLDVRVSQAATRTLTALGG